MPFSPIAPVIRLDGSALSQAFQSALVELRIDRAFLVPAEVTLRFRDAGYGLVSTETAKLGTAVEVVDGPGPDATSLAAAEVTSVAVEQSAGRQPELVVVAHDRSHRLGRGTRVENYVQMTYSDIVEKLVTDCGMTPDVSPTDETMEYVMQVDSDLGLITALARRIGFDWWVDGSTFHFRKPAVSGSTELTLGSELLSFQARASGHGPDSVVVDGWDRAQQEQVESTASTPQVPTATSQFASLADRSSSAFGEATLVTAGVAARTPSEATSLSQALYDRSKSASVSAQGVLSGNGSIALGESVSVKGVGPLSGSYPVTRVEHTYRPASGFRTRFWSGERRPTTLVDMLSTVTATSSGHLQQPGLRIGQVTNINDPDEGGKVKVRFPGVSNTEESGWARVLAVGGGKTRGGVFLPEVGDEVLVGFEANDLRQPVVLGGLYGMRSTMPLVSVEGGKVQARRLTSRLGHSVSLLDGTDPSEQAIVLALEGDEFRVHLGKDKLDLEVPSGTPINLMAGESSISFGDDGAISVSAPRVSITATESFSLSAPQVSVDADESLSLEAGASLELEGGTVKVTAEGPAQIMGEPVMLN